MDYEIKPTSRRNLRLYARLFRSIYNTNLTAKTDIEYSIHQGKMTFHAHDYVDGVRQPARPLTSGEKNTYGKYFGGVQ